MSEEWGFGCDWCGNSEIMCVCTEDEKLDRLEIGGKDEQAT